MVCMSSHFGFPDLMLALIMNSLWRVLRNAWFVDQLSDHAICGNLCGLEPDIMLKQNKSGILYEYTEFNLATIAFVLDSSFYSVNS